MDDKRTLLAFLLIGLIFILSPYYYEWMGISPQPEGPAQQVEAENPPLELVEQGEPLQKPLEAYNQATNKDQPEYNVAADEGVQSQKTLSGAFTPQNITVETPLFNLIFSSKGGILSSAKLHDYELYDGNPVEIIAARGRGLSLILEQIDEVEDLSEAEFKPSREKIILEQGTQNLILRAELAQGRVIEKVFTFYADRYGFDMELRYQGFSEDVDAFISWQGGVPFTEKNQDIDLPEMGSIASFNDERIEIKIDDNESETWSDQGDLHWIGARNKYFLTAIVPTDQQERYSARLLGNRTGRDITPNYSFEIGRQLSSSGSWKNTVYLGPLNYDNLIRYDVGLEQAIDFGWPIIRSVSKFLLIVFKMAHNYIPNYGWIIVLFAVVIKIIVYPLTHKTYESAGKMQEIQPKIAALREKYKNDAQRLSQETMKLYKEEGVNPLSGCLPMFLQMPIFISLYNIFGKTIELRQAPFMLWIDDLSTPDEVIVGGFGLHILPLLMALSMLIQQKMTMKDPKQAFLVYFMPVFMIFIFWSMSSGLVLYWTLFNILTIGQQLLVNHFKKGSIAGSNPFGLG